MTTEAATTTAPANAAPTTTAPGTSVVTPERYHQGIPTFLGWMNAIEKNREYFQRHYDEYQPSLEDERFFKKAALEHGLKALVIGEDWCPDVWRGLPVIAKLGAHCGMEVRAFFRDQNKDIMAEFLNRGEFESIPTIVFYDRDHNYLCHWIERAKEADEGLAALRKQVFPETMPERDTPVWNELQEKFRIAAIDAAEPWRQAQAREMREMVAEALAKRA
jgi:hypothetical protein